MLAGGQMANNAGDDPLCSYSLTDADAGKVTDETSTKPHSGLCVVDIQLFFYSLTDADAGKVIDKTSTKPHIGWCLLETTMLIQPHRC
jgi:hypothetical protein